MASQLLLGVADRQLSSALIAQFHELPEVQVVGVENTSEDVIAAAAGIPRLDVVLVHQAIGPLPVLDLIRQLGLRYPQLAVVLIAEEANAETFAAAMAVGARGVISREPTLAELQSRIRQAAEWSRSMRRHFDSSEQAPGTRGLGTLVTFCGAKGGTGTTTLAVHLAIALTKSLNVCLIDMDLQKGDIPGFLDVRHRHSIADLVTAADDLDGVVLSEALFVHKSGPHLLLAPDAGEDAEEISARATRQILTMVRSRYDLVIVDSGSHVADANAVAVELADQVVVTSTPDLPSLRGVKRLMSLWSRLQIRKEEDVTVVLTRQDKRNEIQPDLARKMIGGARMPETSVPAVFRALEEAANTGMPTVVKSTDFRKAIGRLTRELKLVDDPAAEAAPAAVPRDQGSTAIQFAALIPFLGFLLLVAWQTVYIGLTSMHSSHAANEAARAVAVLGYDKRDTEKARANRAEVRRRTVARIAEPWGDAEHLSLDVRDEFAIVTIETPSVIPGINVPFRITNHAKIVREGEGE